MCFVGIQFLRLIKRQSLRVVVGYLIRDVQDGVSCQVSCLYPHRLIMTHVATDRVLLVLEMCTNLWAKLRADLDSTNDLTTAFLIDSAFAISKCSPHSAILRTVNC